MLDIDYIALSATAKEPGKKRAKDAGWDFFADEDVSIGGGKSAAVRTGIAMAVRDGWYGQLQGRSGLASRGVQPRAFIDAETGDVLGGAIDCTYRGEIIVLLFNLDLWSTFVVKKGDKIAQMMFHPVPDARFHRVDMLPNGDRGADGFGASDGSGSGVSGDHAGSICDPFKFDDLDGGKASGPINVDAWVTDLASDLFRKRRSYTNQPESMYVRKVAEMIQAALVREGSRAAERFRDQIRGMWDRGPSPYRVPRVATSGYLSAAEAQSEFDRLNRLGGAINRILERRRLVHDLAGEHLAPLTGDEAVKQAAEIWGKGHPIVKEVAGMFGVAYPIEPAASKRDQLIAREFAYIPNEGERDRFNPTSSNQDDINTNANPPSPPFKVPPTINIHTSSKTGPPEPPRHPDGGFPICGPFGTHF